MKEAPIHISVMPNPDTDFTGANALVGAIQHGRGAFGTSREYAGAQAGEVARVPLLLLTEGFDVGFKAMDDGGAARFRSGPGIQRGHRFR